MRKAKFLILGLAIAMLASCGSSPTTEQPTTTAATEPTTQQSTTYSGDYSVKITAIGSTTIKVSNTLQLRSSVTGTTSKNVTWSSSNDAIATVSTSGLVTGLSVGEVKIKATLDIEPNCFAEINVKVEDAVVPQTITIYGYEDQVQWTEQSLQLGVEVAPADASKLVTWASSDDEIASVTETGYVSFLEKGTVTISATSTQDTNVKGEVTFKVKEGFFLSDNGSPMWNLEHQADDENPYVELPSGTPDGYHSLFLAHTLSEVYYAEAVFHINEQTSSWVWQGIGMGSGLSDNDTRYWIFSPVVAGQGNNYNKMIVKDMPVDSWPPITTRTQVWGENGIDEIPWFDTDMKIGMIRYHNEHYWLINDRVMWYDNDTKFEGTPTIPVFVSVDLPVTIKNYSVTTDETQIQEMLKEPEFNKSFFAAYTNTTYVSDSEFSFNSMNTLCKDHKVKYLGDKAKVMGNFEIEFDFSDLMINTSHVSNGFTGLITSLARYDSADTNESFLIGKSQVQEGNDNFVARLCSWDYTKSMDNPDSMNYYLETSKTQFENPIEIHHAKIQRTIESNKSYFRMFIDGVECEFDIKMHNYDVTSSKYTGAYLIWVGGEYASCSVSNFVIKSNI